MPLRLVTVTCDEGHEDTLTAIAQTLPKVHYEVLPSQEGRTTVSMLVGPDDQQAVMDQIQKILGASDGWRAVVFPVEAAVPSLNSNTTEKAARKSGNSLPSREELHADVEKGARLNGNYLLLVVLSTITAAIGLIENNIAVLIGAMVIAPLLGPNLALILGTALGDKDLVGRALRTFSLGLIAAFLLSMLIGALVPIDKTGPELMGRTDVGLDSVALALASGAAAALSLLTGLSSTLVGVMVAVALLPPVATLGIMISLGNIDAALGAFLLLAVNVVCVNLSGQLVFLARGVTPRTGPEKKRASESTALTVLIWAASLGILIAAVMFRGP